MKLLESVAHSKTEIQFAARIHERYLSDTVNRIAILGSILAFLFSVFGFGSLNFIQTFDPTVTLWSNLWPRLAFNALPLLALSFLLKKSSLSHFAKVICWQVGFSLVFDAACLTHVWPLALSGHPEILLHVDATNTSLFACVILMQAMPLKETLYSLSIFGVLSWIPLGYVAIKGGNANIANTVIGDVVFLETAAILGAITIYRTRLQVAVHEIEREVEASKFLGPAVSKAIFENKQGILERQERNGFIINIDIRDSTEMQKKYGQKWLDFRKEYFSIVAKAVQFFGGYIQKTAGDCHIINFGIMDEIIDLSDIPGLERENAEVEEKRLQIASDSATECIERIFTGFQKLARRHFPGETVKIGAGVDKGLVERGIQGDRITLELDINGDAVNCASRLQEYSKALKEEFDPSSSVIVFSPFACDYIPQDSLSLYKRIDTASRPIRNYPNIKWVLAREFRAAASEQIADAA